MSKTFCHRFASLLLLLLFLIAGFWYSQATSKQLSPTTAAFLQTLPVGGTIFHDGPLTKNLEKVFGKSRLAILTDPELLEITTVAATFSHLARRLDIHAAIITHRDSRSEKLLEWLAMQLTWHLVHCDEQLAVFLDNAPGHLATIEKYKISSTSQPLSSLSLASPNPTAPTSAYYARAQALLIMNLPQKAMADLQTAAQWDTTSVPRRLLLGRLAMLDGKLAQAQELFAAIWQSHQDKVAAENLLKICLQTGTEQSLAQGSGWCDEMRGIFSLADWTLYKTQFLHLQGKKAQAVILLKDLLHRGPHPTAFAYLQELERQSSHESLETLMRQVRQLIRSQQQEQAIAVLRQAIQQNKAFGDGYLELGKLYWQRQQYALALETLQRANELLPQHPPVLCYMAMSLAGQGDWQSALEMILPLVDRYQDRYDVRTALQWIDNKAIELLTAQQQEFAKNPAAGIRFAQILARQERVNEAITLLDKLRRQVPPAFEPEYTSLLGKFYYEEGKRLMRDKKPDLGLELIRRCVSLLPNFFEGHLFLADIALKKRDWDNAFLHFQALDQIAPQDDRGRYGLALIELGKGLALQLEGDYSDALEKFGLFLQKAPETQEKEAIRSRIDNLRKQKAVWQTVEKKSQLKKHFATGAKALQEKQWEVAIGAFEATLALDPGLAEAAVNLGLAYLHTGNIPKAQATFEKALESRPKLADAHLHLGFIAYRAGEFAQAQHHFALYLEQDPQGKSAAQVREIVEWLGEEKK